MGLKSLDRLLKVQSLLVMALVLFACGGQPESDEEAAAVPAPSLPLVDISQVVKPADGTYGEGSSIFFQVQWAQVVNVIGVPRLPLNVGGVTVYADYLLGSGSDTLSFRYIIQSGDEDSDGISLSSIDLNGGSIQSASLEDGALDIASLTPPLAAVLVSTATTPPSQVTNLQTAPSVNSGNLSVSWNAANGNGNPILNYVLQYRQKGTSVWIPVVPNPTANSSTISGLTSGIDYELRVAANNGVLGDFSLIQEASIFNINDFDPIAWLDATDIHGDGSSVANGSLVATWVDKTGAAENATEADPARQPVYQENIQNGLSAVRFDNLDRGLQGGFSRANGTQLTIFVVGQYDTGFNDRCMFEFIGGSSARAFFIDRRYASNNFYSPALTKGEFKLWRIQNTGASAVVTENSTTELYNGGLTFNTDFVGNGTYYLGDDSTGNNRLNGFIGEVLIFDSALSAQEILSIESYLMTKWGL